MELLEKFVFDNLPCEPLFFLTFIQFGTLTPPCLRLNDRTIGGIVCVPWFACIRYNTPAGERVYSMTRKKAAPLAEGVEMEPVATPGTRFNMSNPIAKGAPKTGGFGAPAMSIADASLPPGWSRHVNPGSEKDFYVTASGETTWDLPAVSATIETQNDAKPLWKAVDVAEPASRALALPACKPVNRRRSSSAFVRAIPGADANNNGGAEATAPRSQLLRQAAELHASHVARSVRLYKLYKHGPGHRLSTGGGSPRCAAHARRRRKG